MTTTHLSQRIRSPFSAHKSMLPLPSPSHGFNIHQSPIPSISGWRSLNPTFASSECERGTTCNPPTSSVTSINGTIPCTAVGRRGAKRVTRGELRQKLHEPSLSHPSHTACPLPLLTSHPPTHRRRTLNAVLLGFTEWILVQMKALCPRHPPLSLGCGPPWPPDHHRIHRRDELLSTPDCAKRLPNVSQPSEVPRSSALGQIRTQARDRKAPGGLGPRRRLITINAVRAFQVVPDQRLGRGHVVFAHHALNHDVSLFL
mmetsp:Transcript_100796/g.289121  ORF Transcript_100796/g.289121 Transcript_100796/m.289121 type:complete len:258 (+) Transcript_100796:573-1346(+)